MQRPLTSEPHLLQTLTQHLRQGLTLGAVAALAGCSSDDGGSSGGPGPGDPPVSSLEQGRDLFRDGTLGMEGFWSGVAGFDTGLAQAGFSTLDALALGLHLDENAMDPATLVDISDEIAGGLAAGNIETLTDPLVFEELLGSGAVVGLVGVELDGTDGIALNGPDSLGISCALCHSVVDGPSLSGLGLAGTIGLRVDGQSPTSLRVGALFALAERSSALYPYMTQSHGTIGGAPIGRTGTFLEASSTEAQFDAFLNDATNFPAGQWDMTPDGIGNPTVLPSVFDIGAASLYGTAGEIDDLADAINAHVTLGLDPTTLLTSTGSQFMNAVALGVGTEIVNEYTDIFNDTGAIVPVGGLPFVTAALTGTAIDGQGPVGFRLGAQELDVLGVYLESLGAPLRPLGDAQARARGGAIFASDCASCHGQLDSLAPNGIVSLLDLLSSYTPSTLLARGFPFSDMLNDISLTYDDRLVVFDRLYTPAQIPGQARDIAVPSLRGLELREAFLHDGSVSSLDALFDSARGVTAPHAFFADPADRADLIEFLVTR